MQTVELEMAYALSGVPNRDTFSIKPIEAFVRSYLAASTISVDPFARNKRWATYTNDLNPDTEAECHMDAEAFVHMLASCGVLADLALFDPPYSPRQMSECYKGVGLTPTTKDTQNAALYARVRNALLAVVPVGGVVLSFGWNSGGMGKTRGFVKERILLVNHGAAHNDTICVAERRVA